MEEEWIVLKKRLSKFSHNLQYEVIPKLIHDNTIAGHPEGIGLYNRFNKLYYVLIPKNASTTMTVTTLFYGNNSDWRMANFLKEDLDIKKFIVVLRDPVKRYISAVNMFLSSGEPMHKTSIFKNKIFSDDCHFRSQSEFIARFPKDKIDFFYFNNSILSDITNYYNLRISPDHHHNASTHVVTAVDESLLKSLYKDDYNLINSVNFINVKK